MESNKSANKRIARNTIALFVRSILSMAITLYTSRVILHVLGIIDFGIYTVIAGMVGMLTMFTGTIAHAVSRFLSYALGKNDYNEVQKVYSASMNIIILVLVIVVVLAETIGLYFLNKHLNIPHDRLIAANWVYQAVVVSFSLQTLNIANNASIIAFEKMSFFAYMGIFDAVTKLMIVWGLYLCPYDKLILYSLLLCCQQLFMIVVYMIYVKRNLANCSYRFGLYKDIFSRLFSFIGWTFISSVTFIAKNQGVDLLLNLYFGPVVNAAKGISAQVQNATSQLGTNFLTAISPQVTKSYANSEYQVMLNLVFKGIRFSSYLLLLLMLPIIFNVDFILHLWLVEVPENASIFVVLALGFCVFETCSLPLHYGIMASGKIRNYQLGTSFIQLLNLPVSFLCLWLGGKPYIVMLIAILFAMALLLWRVIFLRRLVHFSYVDFLKKVCIRIFFVVLIVVAIDCLIRVHVESIFLLIKSVLVISFINMITIYVIGLQTSERNLINNKIKYNVVKFCKYNK